MPPHMKSLAKLTLLKSAPRQETDDDHDRVLALFKNRAELKKAYGELQDEVYRLKDRIKQQEGATARVQEMLGALEMRLGLIDTAYPALVFYQLRAFWQLGREIIEQFVGDLARQQEERERRLHVADCNRRQFARRQNADAELRSAETQLIDAQARLNELQQAREKLTRFWHYFKRREMDLRLQEARGVLSNVESGLTTARDAVTALENEATPQFPGLSLETRRAINLAAMAYAEALCLRLADTKLVSLAKEATSRREAADQYGGRAECEALIAQIAKGRTALQAKSNIAQDVKARTDRLKQISKWRHPADTVPTTESLALSEGDVMENQAAGRATAARMPNVLAEDTWDLFRILLR
jgi:hypothetical protein